MIEEKPKRHTDRCYDCNESMELFEIDLQKSKKVMFCKGCGLFHYYKKDFLGNWKIRKVSKTPEIAYDERP